MAKKPAKNYKHPLYLQPPGFPHSSLSLQAVSIHLLAILAAFLYWFASDCFSPESARVRILHLPSPGCLSAYTLVGCPATSLSDKLKNSVNSQILWLFCCYYKGGNTVFPVRWWNWAETSCPVTSDCSKSHWSIKIYIHSIPLAECLQRTWKWKSTFKF